MKTRKKWSRKKESFIFFSWSLFWSGSWFLVFLITFLVEFLFPFLFSYFLDRFLGRALVFLFSFINSHLCLVRKEWYEVIRVEAGHWEVLPHQKMYAILYSNISINGGIWAKHEIFDPFHEYIYNDVLNIIYTIYINIKKVPSSKCCYRIFERTMLRAPIETVFLQFNFLSISKKKVK